MIPKTNEKEQARDLRAKGKSLREIAGILKVSRSSVSGWVKDIVLTDEQKDVLSDRTHDKWDAMKASAALSSKCKEQRAGYREIGNTKAKDPIDSLYLAGCMLYWGEGSKSRSQIQFTNTDAGMLVLFKKFLTDCLGVDPLDISIYIHYHTNGKCYDEISSFWLSKLELPESCLRKATLKPNLSKGKSKHENGICRICVCRTSLVQEIYGFIEGFAGLPNGSVGK